MEHVDQSMAGASPSPLRGDRSSCGFREAVVRALGPARAARFAWFDPRGVTRVGRESRAALLEDGREVDVTLCCPASVRGHQTDFLAEADGLDRYAERARLRPELDVVRPIRELTEKGVLTTTRAVGGDLDSACRWPPAARQEVASTLAWLLVEGLFEWGEVLLDPDLSGFRFRLEEGRPRLVLRDVGLRCEVAAHVPAALRELLLEVAGDGHGGPRLTERLEALGFSRAVLERSPDRLPELVSLICEPLLWPGPYAFELWHLPDRVDAALGPAGELGRGVPPDLRLALTAVELLVGQLRRLKASARWAPSCLSALQTPPRLRGGSAQASKLRLEARRARRGAVSVDFRPEVLTELGRVVPAGLDGLLASRDIGDLGRRALQEGLHSRVLLDVEDGPLALRIWLE